MRPLTVLTATPNAAMMSTRSLGTNCAYAFISSQERILHLLHVEVFCCCVLALSLLSLHGAFGYRYPASKVDPGQSRACCNGSERNRNIIQHAHGVRFDAPPDSTLTPVTAIGSSLDNRLFVCSKHPIKNKSIELWISHKVRSPAVLST